MRIPDNLDFVQAAAVPEVFFTAYDALFNHCELAMGESVLIHAAGSGVGTAAVQLAHNAGAYVFGTAGSADKLQGAKDLGMDVGINYREQDFSEVVREHTGGAGVDVLLDVIGADYWDRNLASLALRGRLVLVGTMGGGAVQVNLGPVMFKRLRVNGTVLRSRPIEEKIALDQPDQAPRPALSSQLGGDQAGGGQRLPAGGCRRGAPLHGEQRQLRQDHPVDGLMR